MTYPVKMLTEARDRQVVEVARAQREFEAAQQYVAVRGIDLQSAKDALTEINDALEALGATEPVQPEPEGAEALPDPTDDLALEGDR